MSNVTDLARTESECIEHSRKARGAGYGYEQYRGKQVLSHRLAYCKANNLSVEEIAGAVVRHKCDNPRCINPAHLELGTQSDNMKDMEERGRRVRGEEVGNAKLTASQVDSIRREYRPRSRTANQYSLALKYGVSQSQISMIISGNRWQHTTKGASE